MRRSPLLAAAALAVAGLTLSAVSVPPNALPTTTTKLADKSEMKQYPVLDAKGRRVGKAAWRVTRAGGNCCEVLLHATKTGRLVEFGGTYPIYSDDQGRTWTEVTPAVPASSRLPNPGPRKIAGGEGAIVMAPGGDIVGIGWDPYSGDRLQSFFYSAKDKKWYYGEAPIHEPFYDRQWIAVAKGPFTIKGATVPYVSLVLSNYHRGRNVTLMSTDGINYFAPTARQLDVVRNGTVTGYLPVKPDAELDYTQQQAQSGMAMLSQYAIATHDVQGCGTQILKSDGSWACFELPNETEINGPLQTDSRGWVHEVRHDGGEMVYRLSKDGGRTWVERRFMIPGGMVAETYDFKAHGKLGITAIATHAKKDDGTFQDVVMRLSTKSGVPVLERSYFVGDGNLKSTVGLDPATLVSGASDRVDFTSVVILPNGKIGVSFADKTFSDPAIAVLA